LYEHSLDDRQQGLFSNAREKRQVEASQFVFADKVFITGIRWYGYYTCNVNPNGISRAFDVRFYPDKDGLPDSQPIYSAGVEAHVTRTTANVVPDPVSGVNFQVYAYTLNLPGPLTVPAGQPMWISISAEPSSLRMALGPRQFGGQRDQRIRLQREQRIFQVDAVER
jgi:hypothetical protein